MAMVQKAQLLLPIDSEGKWDSVHKLKGVNQNLKCLLSIMDRIKRAGMQHLFIAEIPGFEQVAQV